MQQGGGLQFPYGLSTSMAEIAPPATTSSDTHLMQQPVEAASPISSRPPAEANLDELMGLATSDGADEGALEGDRGGGGGGGSGGGGGNRWPRQETLALIEIRTDMDTAFRDATVKGPLWEDVSRKLAELGYRRSAKKCKEKFENVHKYHKRKKEGRAGRQDGKSYKFFQQLEALHNTTTATASTSTHVSASQAMPVTATASASLDVSPVSIGIPMPIPSVRITQPPPQPPPTTSAQVSFNVFPHNLSAAMPLPPTSLTGSAAPPPAVTTGGTNVGISFSSNSWSSSSQGTEDDDDDDDDNDQDESEGQPQLNSTGRGRKRKRRSGGGGSTRMMEFFEKLMRQVMQKQEAMQKRFLEVIERREQDKIIREEAWKRQETARLSREHELMAQERAISSSRDAAIVSFLHKLTGQTIQLPQPVTIPAFTPPPPQPVPAIHVTPSMPPQSVPPQQPPQSNQQKPRQQHSQPISSEVVMAEPEQQIPPQDVSGGGNYEPISSRWPKTEVLALINLRSGLESKYQEAGTKGPLWEEISVGMTRLGYKRSSKRCKEKWENINKYFKKVKESNKKRLEDSKTCPYYHQLDALYRKKVLNSTSGGGSMSTSGTAEQWQQQESTDIEPFPATRPSNVPVLTPAEQASPESQNKNVQASNVGLPSSLFEEGNGGGATKEKTL
ncbi:trihelix transcription factor GTL1-like isoform X2 [Tripterygium wilfordii]|uniref:trihelix transcription factor GTL1-like isoform X2 n=1 Tax=Tripterygium wilfordii TaxID=458696 RepID=UPI0018F7ED25|nr:trihelix transcription factor GTL1-like isoform X2 [Tripterygium wilfordii]